MTHTLIVFVEDKPGVLNRVASLLRRRMYNIESLAVGRTHRPGISQMTVTVEADADAVRRIEANLCKLVNVLSVENITDTPAVVRELALIQVTATAETRSHLLQVAEVFRARVVNLENDSLMIEITGLEEKTDSLLRVLVPFGVLGMVRTGRVAMQRSPGISHAQPENEELKGQSIPDGLAVS